MEEKGKKQTKGQDKRRQTSSRSKTLSESVPEPVKQTETSGTGETAAFEAPTGETVQENTESASGRKTLYRVKFFYEWCKSCGICSAMCPVKIISTNEQGHPFIEDEDACIGCRNCEIHCPDFAITVKKRYPERRKTNGIS